MTLNVGSHAAEWNVQLGGQGHLIPWLTGEFREFQEVQEVLLREYMEKVKQLEKYIEPLRRMIPKIGTTDQDR